MSGVIAKFHYPINDIYNHLDVAELSSGSSSSDDLPSDREPHHRHHGREHRREPLTPPPVSSEDRQISHGSMKAGSPIVLEALGEVDAHDYITSPVKRSVVERRKHQIQVLTGNARHSDDRETFLSASRATSTGPRSSPANFPMEGPQDTGRIVPSPNTLSTLPRIATQEPSPPPIQGSKLSLQSSLSSSISLLSPSPELASHLSFISAKVPRFSPSSIPDHLGQDVEAEGVKERAQDNDRQSLAHFAGHKPSDPAATHHLNYDTESTLSLDSFSGGSDGEPGASDRDLMQDDDAHDFSRLSKSLSTSTASPATSTTATRPTTRERGAAKYKHGHALQRMPGQVKDFGQVPHYYHQVHPDRLGSTTPSSTGQCSGMGTPLDPGGVELEGDCGAGAQLVQGGGTSPSSGQHAAHTGCAHDLGGLAFVNLNLSETGRDPRVLVRSKQIVVGGNDIEEYGRVIEDLVKEEPMLFEDTDDEYHRKLIMHPRDKAKWMIKRLPLSSSELLVLLELNQQDVRNHPWNPAPNIVSAVDRPHPAFLRSPDIRLGPDRGEDREDEGRLGSDDDDVFLFFEPLEEHERNEELNTVEDYLGVFHDLLKGLTFLHEHNIAGFRCSLPRSFMHTPRGTEINAPLVDPYGGKSQGRGDPVRYKFVDFAEARRVVEVPAPSPLAGGEGTRLSKRRNSIVEILQNPATNTQLEQDVKDLGMLFRFLLAERIPQIKSELDELVEGMAKGVFHSVDEARREYEDLVERWSQGEAERDWGVSGLGRELDIGVAEDGGYGREDELGRVREVLSSRARPRPRATAPTSTSAPGRGNSGSSNVGRVTSSGAHHRDFKLEVDSRPSNQHHTSRQSSTEFDPSMEESDGDHPAFYYDASVESGCESSKLDDGGDDLDEEGYDIDEDRYNLDADEKRGKPEGGGTRTHRYGGTDHQEVQLEDKDGSKNRRRKRSGTITAQFAVPGWETARLTEVEIRPAPEKN